MPNQIDVYDAQHPDYVELCSSYTVIDDAMRGEQHVKSLETKYLPQPRPSDKTSANELRYKQYKQRATFSNYTHRMVRTLIGIGFLRKPVYSLPPELQGGFEQDVTGSGLPIIQFAKELAMQVMLFGAAGVLVDHPPRNKEQMTRLEAANLRFRPYLDIYRALEITNWLVQGYRLKFVILRRPQELVSGYSVWTDQRWRILEMVGTLNSTNYAHGGRYAIKEYGAGTKSRSVFPTDYNGEYFDHILFHRCGADNNDWSSDYPPMYNIATNNFDDYVQSAEAAEISYIAGQPQYFFSGLDNQEAKDKQGSNVIVGARQGVFLGPDGKAFMLQPNPNILPLQLKEEAQKTMEKLGVQLAVGTATMSKATTATEVVTESLMRNSVLTSVLENVTLTVTAALKDACLFVGADPEKVKFEIDTSVEMSVDETVNAVSSAVRGQDSRGLQQQRPSPVARAA